MKKLEIVCEELVALPVGNGIYQHVIFKPTHETKAAIRRAVDDKPTPEQDVDDYYDLTVTDNGGSHTSNRPHRFLVLRAIRNVLVVTTQEW